MPYTLALGWSSSPHYPAVRRLAGGLAGARTEGHGREAVVTLPVPGPTPPALLELLDLVIGWRRTTLRRDGIVLPRAQLWRLQTVLACWAERQQSGGEAWYCRGDPLQPGPLPCQLVAAVLPWDPPRAPAAAWRAWLHDTARELAVDACPVYAPAAAAADLLHWASSQAALPTADEAWLRGVLADLDWPDDR